MTVLTPRTVEVHKLGAVALAVVLVLHGVAHFAGSTDLSAEADARQDVYYLGGLWTISDPSVLRVVGVLWAVVGALVVLSAGAVLLRHRYARQTVVVAALLSLALSVVGLWAAIVGVGVNLALLALVAFAPQRVGLRTPS
ncbi:MAG: hypothetical protein ACRDWG_08905 [Actinomycetes bacterium]